MPDYSPKFSPGADITLGASATILGGQLLVVSAVDSVAPAGGSNPSWAGVARQDAAQGERVVVCRGGVQKLIAAGNIAAGDRVTGASAGRVATGTTNIVGTAMNTVLDGMLVLVLLDR